MSYPNGPYGQGFPGQPGYPQQPGFPQPGYPQQPGFPQPGYPQQSGFPGGQQPYGLPPIPPAAPSGVTGIIAGALAVLGVLSNFGSGGIGLFALAVLGNEDAVGASDSISGGVRPWLIVTAVLCLVSGLLLLIGAVTLFQRKMIGRWLVVAGCALTIISGLVSFGVSLTKLEGYVPMGENALSLVGLVFPIATIVLVLMPPTAAWIRAKQNPVAPQFYPPYPG
ncbi:hypothetical protein VST63_25790 [Mycolicibacterium sp. 050232]|uniref:hypothetical protein n=1 Tax=Mycolicibacterium sp. 050232 TaxID=3113982 RepID=UPI002E2BCD6C|nr:hypothetical protein [Mycolicibacterium sp. 050232]MED5815785.1 hypothetical protein [Mycolicibacterium sp. 050232]